MRVINRGDFLRMPPGTIYAKGVQWAFDTIAIKGETCGNDWFCHIPTWVDADDSSEAVARLESMLHEGKSYPMDSSQGRDGFFDDDAVFLIFERPDLLLLKTAIEAALNPPPREA